MDEELVRAIERLVAKVKITEMVAQGLLIDRFLQRDDPVADMRAYAERIEERLTSDTSEETSRLRMEINAEIANFFAAVENTLRQK